MAKKFSTEEFVYVVKRKPVDTANFTGEWPRGKCLADVSGWTQKPSRREVRARLGDA
jgi:hypothetical protein